MWCLHPSQQVSSISKYFDSLYFSFFWSYSVTMERVFLAAVQLAIHVLQCRSG